MKEKFNKFLDYVYFCQKYSEAKILASEYLNNGDEMNAQLWLRRLAKAEKALALLNWGMIITVPEPIIEKIQQMETLKCN